MRRRKKLKETRKGSWIVLKAWSWGPTTLETGHRSKGITVNSHNNKGAVGGRYLDRMRSNFFSSSRTLGTGGFLGKGQINSNVGNTRENRYISYSDHSQNTPNKRDFVQNDRGFGKSNPHLDNHNHIRPVSFLFTYFFL